MPEKKDLNVLIGTNIRQAREAAGFTQEKFSEMIGIGPKSLSAIERGTVGISLAALTARLALLTEEEFRLCSEIICKLLEALQHGKS